MRLLTPEETTSYRYLRNTIRQIIHTGNTQDLLRLLSLVDQFRANQLDIHCQQQETARLEGRSASQKQPQPEPQPEWRQEGSYV